MTAKVWQRKDLLGLQGLSVAEIETLLNAADQFKKDRNLKDNSLSGRTVAFLFSEPSTRTRSSFEVAAKKLGADILGFSIASSSLLKGESLLDTIKNLEAMGIDYCIIRHEESGVLENIAPRVKASLLNAGDGAHEHPTQALLDIMTMREKKGSIQGLRVVIVGDILHSRVARSNIFALKKLGARVTVCGPGALIPKDIEKLGAKVSHDLDSSLKDADAVNVLRLQLERQKDNYVTSVSDYFESFGLTNERLAKAKAGCLVLHPGPMNRGVEIASDVADGPQSVILEQVQNGVFVRMAALALLERGENRG